MELFCSRNLRLAIGLLLLLTVAGVSQIVTDGSLGPSMELTGSTVDISADLGQIRGSNLFHSFSDFSIMKADETATFTGPDSIRHIVSRVTGANESVINGTLGSTIPGANLFFINPNGVSFGPNATLNVRGSFIVTTADYIKFEDAEFHASLSHNSQLSVAAPQGFGFLDGNPNTISIQQSTLTVEQGNRLSFIGGDIEITGGSLHAPSGRITIASLASPAEVTNDVSRLLPNDEVLIAPDSGQISLGQVNVNDSSTIDTGGDGGGNVIIRGGRFALDDEAGVFARSSQGAGGRIGIDVDSATLTNRSRINAASDGGGNGGTINIQANETVTLSNSAILNQSFGNVEGGDVKVITKNLHLVNGARINSLSNGPVGGGNIEIAASGTVVLSDSEIFNRTIGRGDAGFTSITAENLRLEDGSQINSSSPRNRAPAGSTPGSGGLINIEVTDSISLSSSFIVSQTQERGNAGQINLESKNLSLTDGSRIQSSTFGDGDGGAIIVDVEDTALITGVGKNGMMSGIFSNSGGDEENRITTGNGGNIVVRSGDLILSESGTISANSDTAGSAGNILVGLTNNLFSENATITTAARMSDGGNIVINANNLTHLVNSTVRADVGDPDEGPPTVGGNITMVQKSAVLRSSDIIANANEGNGGNIAIAAGVFMADPGSTVDASSNQGIDGVVDIQAPVANIAESLIPLTQDYLSAAELLSAPCEARLSDGKTSSFILGGRLGQPIMPGTLLPTSFIFGDR